MNQNVTDPRTPREIIDQTENLARRLARADGWTIFRSSRLYKSQNPRVRTYWKYACVAQEELTQTNPEDAIVELEDSNCSSNPTH